MDGVGGIIGVGGDFLDVEGLVDVFFFLADGEGEWAFAEPEEIDFFAGLEDLAGGFGLLGVIAFVEGSFVEGVDVIDGEDFVADLLLGEGDADAGVAGPEALEEDSSGVDGGFAGVGVGVGELDFGGKVFEVFAAGVEGVEDFVDGGF